MIAKRRKKSLSFPSLLYYSSLRPHLVSEGKVAGAVCTNNSFPGTEVNHLLTVHSKVAKGTGTGVVVSHTCCWVWECKNLVMYIHKKGLEVYTLNLLFAMN